VGSDVVHDRCGGEASHLITLDAKRVGRKIALPCSPPPGVIAAASSRPAFPVDFLSFLSSVSFAALMRGINKIRTSRKSAWMLWCVWAQAAFRFS
jgi:hypothetical protein